MEIKEVKHIGDVFDSMYERNLLINIEQGFKDVINGYGWHQAYYVKIRKVEFYCLHCDKYRSERKIIREEAKNLKGEILEFYFNNERLHYGNCKWDQREITVLSSYFEFKEHLLKAINEEIINKNIRGSCISGRG